MNSATPFDFSGQQIHIVPQAPEENQKWSQPDSSSASRFVPTRPESLEQAELKENDIFRIVMRYLYIRGAQTGREIAAQVRLPFSIVEPLLNELRQRMLITYRGAAIGGDYEYELTPTGMEHAKRFYNACTYCGSAPVSLKQYVHSVYAQTLKKTRPGLESVENAFGDLVVSRTMISQLGQAIRSGKSVLLHGAPGNGKTSMARRMIRAVDANIWIPRTIIVGGEIVRLFDASVHEEVKLESANGIMADDVDHRWVLIKRPLIVVGGELSSKHLEATLNPNTGIIEAPIHLKSNCGCLVIDDFGRQKISTVDLLNRWIIPLESGQDYINLPTGRQIQVPFEQLLAFSTNLDPMALCDEAFLRRIKYKIEVANPSPEQFRQLWEQEIQQQGFAAFENSFDYLVTKHYQPAGRPFRFCHVQDLLDHVRDFCEFHEIPLAVKPETLDVAVLNYF